MISAITEQLALHGGPAVIQRELNRYKGASALGDEEKQAVMEVLDSRSLFRDYGPNLLSKVAAPQILNQWTITDGCPFRCSTYFTEPIEYKMGMCPRSEDLLARSVSISIGPFYEEEDLDDVIVALQKVAYHLV